MYGSRGIKLFDHACGFVDVGAETAFVSERPHNYARSVFITCYQQSFTVKYGILKNRVPGYQRYSAVSFFPFERIIYIHTAVGFKVAFVDHVKTVSVAELVEERGIRIMGCPYGVDVKLLHLDKVHLHMSYIRIISGIRIAVVPVCASELCMTVVDLENQL